MKGFTTKVLHTRYPKKDVHGSLRPPLYDSVAFEFDNASEIQQAFEGKLPAHTYSRISNPTVEDFETKMRVLTDSRGVIAVSSGMAAITNVILTLCSAGSNIVSSRHLFGNTISLFEKTLKDWGLEVRYADMSDPGSIESKIDDHTRALYLESITNPQLEVVDFSVVSGCAERFGVPLVLDGTLTTPFLFRSRDYGVAVEVVSTTKYISGGATGVGGVIIDNGLFDWGQSPKVSPLSGQYGQFAFLAKLRREVFRNCGSCMAPHHAWLNTLGLETLALRVRQSSDNAMAIARFLAGQPEVKAVNYPGLPESKYHAAASVQFRGLFGGLVSFELEDRAQCFRFIDSLAIIRKATNLNDNKSLIIHPASTIFGEYTVEERLDMGIAENMLRLSAGIEDREDLIDDIKQGLKNI
ncbi:PLP-dependent transferase [Prosthecochloris sp. SCSIO W1102]|uniref:PLP-dependent transferase n=1 Tax=Prosthecochloris sp. SCSIO W1102 TaxID=2992243 RepID=UPI00223C9B90|nr:PLP-dependent transferase [Prosthecochloris sp. SCSIO W1102]UZJ39830.1 PLP-dependent transferase [Prosthecochloris sp. SCSIO W1102]